MIPSPTSATASNGIHQLWFNITDDSGIISIDCIPTNCELHDDDNSVTPLFFFACQYDIAGGSQNHTANYPGSDLFSYGVLYDPLVTPNYALVIDPEINGVEYSTNVGMGGPPGTTAIRHFALKFTQPPYGIENLTLTISQENDVVYNSLEVFDTAMVAQAINPVSLNLITLLTPCCLIRQ